MPHLIEEEKELRMRKLRRHIEEAQADACVITSCVNQYYLLGFVFDGYLYIAPEEEEPLLFVKRRGAESARYRTVSIRKPEQIAGELRRLPKRILAETASLSYNAVVRLQEALGGAQVTDVSAALRSIRSVKSEYELEELRACARIHDEVYAQIPRLYRRGMRDIDLQIELEYAMRKAGSLGFFKTFGENMDIFMGSVLTGENAQTPSPFDFALGGGGLSRLLPLGANGTPLIPGNTVMVDMAGNFRPTMSDMSRSFAVEHAPDAAYRAHEVSLDIHRAIAGEAKAGTPCCTLWQIAEEIARAHRLEEFFMGRRQQAKFVGHGVGLEINEPPVLTARSREVLQAQTVLAVEPKFVLPGIGAVGVENTYVVRESGLEKITLCEEKMLSLQN